MFGRRLINTGGEVAIPTSFNTVTYTGDGSANNNIGGVGFQPDLVWIKSRNRTWWNHISDTIRGNNNTLFSNSTAVENLNVYIPSVSNTDGFTVSRTGGEGTNNSGDTYVAWCWKAGGAAVTNTDGSITSDVSANVDAGFSVVSWTGNESNATIGHGLDTAPRVVIAKSRTYPQNWAVYHYDLGTGKWLMLNGTTGSITENIFGGVHPSATTFSLNGNVVVNKSGTTSIAYCFAEKAGFSKFGSYGGVSTGTRQHTTDFEVAFVMIKSTNYSQGWLIYDNQRREDNSRMLSANSSAAEYTSNNSDLYVTFNSTGFTTSGAFSGIDGNGRDYIYMAFANQF